MANSSPTPISDSPVTDFVKSAAPWLSWVFVDYLYEALFRFFLGLICFAIGLGLGLWDFQWAVLIFTVLTIALWWNFIIRASLLSGIFGFLEGLMPAVQFDKEIDRPITKDAKNAAAHTYNALSDLAATLVLIMLAPPVFSMMIPVSEWRFEFCLCAIGIATCILWESNIQAGDKAQKK